MPFSADNPSSVVVTIIGTLSHSHIHSIGIISYSTTMASSNIPHLIYCCIQYILHSITVNPLVKVIRLPPPHQYPPITIGNVRMALVVLRPPKLLLLPPSINRPNLLCLPGFFGFVGVA